MALQRKLERKIDIDIGNAYTRISGVNFKMVAQIDTIIIFTLIEYDTYMTRKMREDYPGQPLESGKVKIRDWRPEGTIDEQMMFIYERLAESFGVPNVKV